MRTLSIPDWCVIGKVVKIQYPEEITGSDSFYKERIVGYSDNGFFTQGAYCPVYHHTFDEWGKTVKAM